MRPGTILNDYVVVENPLHKRNIAINELEELSKDILSSAKEEADQIIYDAKINILNEKKIILEESLSKLEEITKIHNSIQSSYFDYLISNHSISINDFLSNKENLFNEVLYDMQDKFNNFILKNQNDIIEILLNAYKSIFKEEYSDLSKIQNLVKNNISEMKSINNIDLELSSALFSKFNDDVKSDFENTLNLTISNVKNNQTLEGFIVNTNIGNIKIDLDNQLDLLKKELSSM